MEDLQPKNFSFGGPRRVGRVSRGVAIFCVVVLTAVIGLLLACDWYVAPGFVPSSIEWARETIIERELHVGLTRHDFEAEVRELGRFGHDDSIDLPNQPNSNVVSLTFGGIHGFCFDNYRVLRVDFDPSTQKVSGWKPAHEFSGC